MTDRYDIDTREDSARDLAQSEAANRHDAETDWDGYEPDRGHPDDTTAGHVDPDLYAMIRARAALKAADDVRKASWLAAERLRREAHWRQRPTLLDMIETEEGQP